MKYNIVQPLTKTEFENYYFFRWKILRKPLGLNIKSVKDNLEKKIMHWTGEKGKNRIRKKISDLEEEMLKHA